MADKTIPEESNDSSAKNNRERQTEIEKLQEKFQDTAVKVNLWDILTVLKMKPAMNSKVTSNWYITVQEKNVLIRWP